VTLEQAAAYAGELQRRRPDTDRELAALRAEWDDEVEAAARHADYRVRALAFRSIAQFDYRQKLELLRRGLDDESPGVRGSTLIALEALSRDHPGDVNRFRPLLNDLAARDPNVAVRRLAIVCFRNGTPDRGTIQLLDGIASDDEIDADVRKTAKSVSALLLKRSRAPKSR
jgi:HEAT repeat protein